MSDSETNHPLSSGIGHGSDVVEGVAESNDSKQLLSQSNDLNAASASSRQKVADFVSPDLVETNAALNTSDTGSFRLADKMSQQCFLANENSKEILEPIRQTEQDIQQESQEKSCHNNLPNSQQFVREYTNAAILQPEERMSSVQPSQHEGATSGVTNEETISAVTTEEHDDMPEQPKRHTKEEANNKAMKADKSIPLADSVQHDGATAGVAAAYTAAASSASENQQTLSVPDLQRTDEANDLEHSNLAKSKNSVSGKASFSDFQEKMSNDRRTCRLTDIVNPNEQTKKGQQLRGNFADQETMGRPPSDGKTTASQPQTNDPSCKSSASAGIQPGAFPIQGRGSGSLPAWARRDGPDRSLLQQNGESNHLVPPEYRTVQQPESQSQQNDRSASSAPPESRATQQSEEEHQVHSSELGADDTSVSVVQFPSRSLIRRVSEAFLLQATLVSEDFEDKAQQGDLVVVADPIVDTGSRLRQRNLICIVLCLVLTIIGVVLGLTLRSSTQEMSSPIGASPIFNVSRDEVVATVPKLICYERNPGEGRSKFCDVNDTISQGGGVVNLVAQAFLDQVNHADVVILNSGICRRDISPGNMTRRHAEALLPYGNHIATLEMTGYQLVESLLEGLSNFRAGEDPDAEYSLTGAYPYAAGLRYDVNMTVVDGNFLSDIEVNIRLQQKTWTPLSMDQMYTVATSMFLVEGGDGYSLLETISRDQSPLYETELDGSQLFLLYAKKRGILIDPPLDQYSTKSYVAP